MATVTDINVKRTENTTMANLAQELAWLLGSLEAYIGEQMIPACDPARVAHLPIELLTDMDDRLRAVEAELVELRQLLPSSLNVD